MKRGQLFTTDAVTASVIFLLILSVIFFMHDTLISRTNQAQHYAQIEKKAEFICDEIYNSLTNQAVFSPSKVLVFFNKNYSQIDSEYYFGYEFNIEIQRTDKTVYVLDGKELRIGEEPGVSRNLVSCMRNGLLNKTMTRLILNVWQK